MNDIMFFIGLLIVTLVLGFGCFLIYDDEKRKSKKANRHKVI